MVDAICEEGGMTPIDVLAKVVGKELHHNEPDRPFTDEAWERELRWWRKAKEEAAEGMIDISYTMYADKCYRIARAVLLALAECELPNGIVNELWSNPRTIFREVIRSIAKGGET